jgi:hypothetical protein
MKKPAEYLFKIEGGYTPETLPSKRLGEYLVELSRLFGEPEHVHFDRVRKGSAVLAHVIDEPAVLKVRDRIMAAALARPPEDIGRQRTKLDQMLLADNATATLREVGAKNVVLRFSGRDLAASAIPPVSQEGFVQGELLRVGGIDESAHALIRDGEQIISCELTRVLARELAALLYQPVRVHGQGRWRRTPDGRWLVESFRAHHFTALDESDLREIVARARERFAGSNDEPPDGDELLRLRGDGD